MMASSAPYSGLPLPPLTSAQRDEMRVLPIEIVSGLRILRDDPTPRVSRPDLWPIVAADAIMLAASGWARQALDLGWTPHDLFGVDARDSLDFAGLAVWLDGRRISMIDDRRAVVTDGDVISFFNRGGFGHGKDAGRHPVLLWEYGNG